MADDDVRTAWRWALESGQFKREIAAQPDPVRGELKHIEWDTRGFAGLETEEYLVFDPLDVLNVAAERRSPGKYQGIPCAVDYVRRLESHWYIVDYYTDTDWSHCR